MGAPQDRAKAEVPDDPPNDPGLHSSADTQARWVRYAVGYKMKSNGFAHPDEEEESFIDKVHTIPEEPGREPPGSVPWSKGRTRRRVLANRDARGRAHRDRIMRTVARYRPLRAWEQRGGRLISKRRLRVEQCLCHDDAPPDSSGWPKQNTQLAMMAIRQNPRGAANRITLNPQTPATA